MAVGTVTAAQMLEKIRRLLGEQADSSGDFSQAVWTDQFLLDGINQAMDRCTRYGFWFNRTRDSSLATHATVQAVGTISLTGIATANQTFVIDDQTFTWKASRSTTGEVTIGVGADTSAINIATAITADMTIVTGVRVGTTVVVTAVDAIGVDGNDVVFADTDSANMTMNGSGFLGGTTYGTTDNMYLLSTPNLQQIDSVYVGTSLSSENQYAPISGYDFDNLLGGQYYKIESYKSLPYLYLYPTPTTTTDTIYLRGIDRATQLATADTTVMTNLPDHYHMFLVWSAVVYARYREEEIAMKREAEREAEDIWEQLWMNEIAPGGQQGLRFKHPLDVPR